MFRWFARLIAEELEKERQRREAVAAWEAAEKQTCEHCDGAGESRVRGVRSPTGYEMCCYCGGVGKVVV